jgi:hypothetical protein
MNGWGAEKKVETYVEDLEESGRDGTVFSDLGVLGRAQ